MKTVVVNSEPEIKRILRTAIPDYRKKKVFVSEFPESGISINSYWDGGSKSEFVLLHIPTLSVKPLPSSTHPYFDIAARGMANKENKDVIIDQRGNVVLKFLPADFVLIEHGYFCGKTSTAHVYLARIPAEYDHDKSLPAPEVDND